MGRCLSRPQLAQAQRGVVLIIALILLVVISLLAVTSLRNAGSTETVLGNVRTTELATQAAEIALRHCESSVVEIVTVASGGSSTYAANLNGFTAANILPASTTTTAQWQDISIWDSNSTAPVVLPLSIVNQTATTATYKRPPECMVESLPVMLAGGLSTTASFVITARGFGPEVPALTDPTTRVRPTGTEVWLQSHIELQ